ncbi:MAG: hypothetical protein EHM45_14270 [Desulfobacteraceae bacterium]|nr:MAG: hypothetical protein EHM45_14270 [Desulfobacteraceae bacterium]
MIPDDSLSGGEFEGSHSYIGDYHFDDPDPVRDFCSNVGQGKYFGTGYGENSAMYYADKYEETGNLVYGVGGCFASLWTKDTWFSTTTTLATAGMAADGSVANVAADKRAFWSGGRYVAGKAAMDAAKAEGLTTLEMTTEGKIMETVQKALPESVRKVLWDNLSINWAKGTEKVANAFIYRWNASSSWAKEYEILVMKQIPIIWR